MQTSSTRSRALVPGAVAVVVLHLAALYWPSIGIVGPVSWTDKVVHLLLFAVPTYAVGLALRSLWPVVIGFALHAPVSELIQHWFLTYRSGDAWDAGLDLVGVGIAAVLLVVRRTTRRW
jgi:hypothetical protein